MDMTAMVDRTQSGRRGALASLLAGTVALLSTRSTTEAKKKGKKKGQEEILPDVPGNHGLSRTGVL
jgi:hypothetical protein